MNISSAISFMQENLSALFDTHHLDTLARETGFIQRNTSRMEAIDFVQLMTVEMLNRPDISLDGLCDILSTLNPQAQMSPQALGQRINTAGAAGFLSTVCCECFTQAVVEIFEWTPPEVLTPFHRILLQDNTTIRLHEKLALPFRGCGGSGAKAALKLHAIYDYHRHQFTDITFTDGTTSDTEMGEALVEEIVPHDLVLRDLGYFSINQLKRIEQKEGFFLSRLPKSTGIYFQEDVDATAVDIVSYLDTHHPHQTVVELAVYLGKEKFPVRLIAYRLPEAIINARRRHAKAAARKKSRHPSKEYLCWLRFSFYITNVPLTIWATEVIGTIYRLRWHIELMFKGWKSLLKIDCLKGTSPYRIECLVYGRLCVVCLISMLYGTVFGYAWEFWDREVSAEKLMKWLLRKNRLAQVVRQTDLFSLFDTLLSQLPKRLLKQKRKRKTTLQRIRDQETCDQAFSVYEEECFQKAA